MTITHDTLAMDMQGVAPAPSPALPLPLDVTVQETSRSPQSSSPGSPDLTIQGPSTPLDLTVQAPCTVQALYRDPPPHQLVHLVGKQAVRMLAC